MHSESKETVSKSDDGSKSSSERSPIPKEVSAVYGLSKRQIRRCRSRHLPLSMQLLRPFLPCQDCGTDWPTPSNLALPDIPDSSDDQLQDDELNIPEKYKEIYSSLNPEDAILKPHIVAPMLLPMVYCTPTTQTIFQEYMAACDLYDTKPNTGVMATLRFALPAMRVTGPFHDADMLALGEILLRHCHGGGPLTYLRRLDFSRATKDSKAPGRIRRGMSSHGAVGLAKVLTQSANIEEVRLQRHGIGHYGATVLFLAVVKNPTLKSISLRRCQLGEAGGIAFAEIICPSKKCGLQKIDLSANRIGFRGCLAIEQALTKRDPENYLDLNLDGNLVFQEVMNGVTHGLGLLMALLGASLMYERTRFMPTSHGVACAIYSFSLITLYTSSTLYHSFFTLLKTKFIFEVLDKCAIYLLIAGSYTPFLQIALKEIPLWSVWLLLFIWVCCFFGIYVQAVYPNWKNKKTFSLLMYLGMGWACVISLEDLMATLPRPAIYLVGLGGLAYTGGVPFFVRNNNLDHSIWHLFVLAGSIFHWLSIYWYVVPSEQPTCRGLGSLDPMIK